MKLFITLMINFSCILLWGQNGNIRGNVVLDGKSIERRNDEIFLDLVGKHTVIRKDWGTKLDFSSLPADTFSLRIYDLSCLDTTVENIIVAANQIKELQITVLSTCKYDRSANLKECPVCHKSDQVIPIVYGLLVSIPDSNRKKKKHKQSDFYPGGCEITCCDPNWYCRRDKIEF